METLTETKSVGWLKGTSQKSMFTPLKLWLSDVPERSIERNRDPQLIPVHPSQYPSQYGVSGTWNLDEHPKMNIQQLCFV